MRLFFPLRQKFSRAQKQDQSWILAQSFCRVEIFRLDFLTKLYSELSRITLSSTAQVNAAQAVQLRCRFRAPTLRAPDHGAEFG
jgi:hypothetical protein